MDASPGMVQEEDRCCLVLDLVHPVPTPTACLACSEILGKVYQ